MTVHRVHACIRAMARWVQDATPAGAGAEAGVDPSTIRRKRDGQHWTDREIAAAIAWQIEEQGSSALVADLADLVHPRPLNVSEPEMRSRSLGLGAEASRLAAEIQSRLADGDLSVRDAAEISDGARRVEGDPRRAVAQLDSFIMQAKGGVR